MLTYPLIFYTEFVPTGFVGITLGPVILIRPKYRDDTGLMKHELTHVKQWAYSLGLFPILYLVSKTYRKWAEACAFREQMQWSNKNGTVLSLDRAAEYLSGNYKLGITVEEARTYISSLGSL